MKNEITVKNLEVEIDSKILITKEDFSLKKNEKVGFIGRNGSGKSVFLNLILKESQEKVNLSN